MKRYKSLFEASKSLIICDVQPHDVGKYIKWDIDKFTEFVNTYNKILVLFNGDEFGWESKSDMLYTYEEWGIDTNKCDFYDKGYGWFRGLMDTGYDIGNLVKYMIKNKVNNGRDIEDNILMELLDSDQVPSDNIYIPEVSEEIIKWKNSDIVGGGRNECLAEIEILLDAMNVRYREVKKWIYG